MRSWSAPKEPGPVIASRSRWTADRDCNPGSTSKTEDPWRQPSATTRRSVLLPGVNIFVYAFRTDTERHAEYRN
jgi:hypothetical protein